jgi:NCS1 family nucleobase:cation symporter-1
MITGVIGVMMMPWKLMGDYGSYIYGWLVGYSGLLGPIAGTMIADYFIVRKRELNVDDLYRRQGVYEYSNGVNWRAVLSLVAGIIVALLGTVVPSLRWLYDYAWFVGFAISSGLYVLLMRGTEPMETAEGGLIERNDPVR